MNAFTKVQLCAWVNFLSLFIISGPLLLIYLAAYGLEPHFHSDYVTLKIGKGNKTIQMKNNMRIYLADRNITDVEYAFLQRVRVGCGRLYMRNLVDNWGDGEEVNKAFTLLITAVSIPIISSIVFLIFVPGTPLFVRMIPVLHLAFQVTSVSLALAGCFLTGSNHLCLLNYMFPGFPVQTVLVLLTATLCLTYKVYEARVIIAYCREYFHEWATGQLLEMTDSDEFEELFEKLTAGKPAKERRPTDNLDDEWPQEDGEEEEEEEQEDATSLAPNNAIKMSKSSPVN